MFFTAGSGVNKQKLCQAKMLENSIRMFLKDSKIKKDKIIGQIAAGYKFSDAEWISIYDQDRMYVYDQAEIFYHAMQKGLQYWDKMYEHLASIKYELFNYLRLKPKDDKAAYQFLQIALDLDASNKPVHPLGKIFWCKTGVMSCRLTAGVLKKVVAEISVRDPHVSSKTDNDSKHPQKTLVIN